MALTVTFNHQPKRVRVTPDTTMFKVLTEARDQHKLSDLRQYQLLHRSRPVDLSIPFRLTGISNNASLEIQELEGMGEVEQVRVCVQLRDGNRVQASFGSNATMQRILTEFKLLPALEEFSLGFLRRVIEPHAFATTSLKELGILTGSAMFRVRAVDGLSRSTPPNIQSFSFSKQQSTTLQQPHVSSTKASSSTPSIPSATSESLSRQVVPQSEDVEMKENIDEERISDTATTMSCRDALQLLRNNSFDTVSRIAVTTLMKVITNILSDPENEKLRSIRLSNSVFDCSVGQVKGGLEFLKSVGFTVIPETQMLVLPSLNDMRLLEEGLRLLSIEANDLNIPLNMRPTVRERKENSTFDIFKTQITRVQMQPRGPSTTELLVDALKHKQNQLTIQVKPPRNTIIALQGKRASSKSDSVKIPTEDEHSEQNDAQLLMSSLIARREEMEKKKNFRTQAMRQLDELKRKKVYQTAFIRIQFPDCAVLQACFRPNETIKDVMDHVTECLAEQYKACSFCLYISPPTQKLDTTKTLTELNLVPAALTYLSWLEKPQVEMASIGFYFRSDLTIKELADTKDGCNLLQKAAFPQPLQYETPSSAEPQVEVINRSSSSAQAKATKTPSWLKL